ncbi:MAG: hypothetical protein AAFS11_03445, partial [Planctomycetota bacterium]
MQQFATAGSSAAVAQAPDGNPGNRLDVDLTVGPAPASNTRGSIAAFITFDDWRTDAGEVSSADVIQLAFSTRSSSDAVRGIAYAAAFRQGSTIYRGPFRVIEPSDDWTTIETSGRRARLFTETLFAPLRNGPARPTFSDDSGDFEWGLLVAQETDIGGPPFVVSQSFDTLRLFVRDGCRADVNADGFVTPADFNA